MKPHVLREYNDAFRREFDEDETFQEDTKVEILNIQEDTIEFKYLFSNLFEKLARTDFTDDYEKVYD